MSARGQALLLAVLAVGCGRQATYPATVAPAPAAPRRLTTSGLDLTCTHVVVGPELIRGVLTVRNTSKEPIALVDRWNSWGAYQWTFSIEGKSAGNPQVSWYGNYYTETVLTPGETRHAPFSLHRRRDTLQGDELGWRFLLGGPLGIVAIDEQGKPLTFDATRSFALAQSVVLTLVGSGRVSFTDAHASTAALWAGTASIPSRELDSLDALNSHAQGHSLANRSEGDATSDALTLKAQISKMGPDRTVVVMPKDSASGHYYTVSVKDERGALLQEWEIRNGVPLSASDILLVDVNADGCKDIQILGGIESGKRWYKTWLYQEADGTFAWLKTP
jgi:hypothetical protein